MNQDSLKPGDTYTREIIFTPEDVMTFARVSGDFNPIHFDEDYAAQTPYKKPIVHGMLAASVFSAVLGMHFPGKGSVAVQRDISFIRPVYTGEKYVMHFKVEEVDYASNEGVIKSVLKNNKGQICIIVRSRIKNDLVFCDHP